MEKEINKYKAILYLAKEIYISTRNIEAIKEAFPMYKWDIDYFKTNGKKRRRNSLLKLNGKFVQYRNFSRFYWISDYNGLLLYLQIEHEKEKNSEEDN